MTARQFTIGEVAKLCGVAPRTAAKWFDSGRLRGWRIPGSTDRRVGLEALRDFAAGHGIPIDFAALETPAIVLLTYDDDVAAWVAEAAEPLGWRVVRARESVEVGMRVVDLRPRLLIVDVDVGRITVGTTARAAIDWCVAHGRGLSVIGIGDHDPALDGLFAALIARGADTAVLANALGPATFARSRPPRKRPTEIVA